MATDQSAISNTYKLFINQALVLYLVIQPDGTIVETNTYTEKTIGRSVVGTIIQDIILDFSQTFSLSSITNDPGQQHMLSISTESGLPQTYIFTFYPHGNAILAFGQIDSAAFMQMEKQVLSMNQELGNLTRQLHKHNAKLKMLNEEKENLIKDLQNTLNQVKSLEGIITICSHCKNIRDDGGLWNRVEAYINLYPDSDFSHGICPKCADQFYPDLNLYDD